jgi:hypothetical protein
MRHDGDDDEESSCQQLSNNDCSFQESDHDDDNHIDNCKPHSKDNHSDNYNILSFFNWCSPASRTRSSSVHSATSDSSADLVVESEEDSTPSPLCAKVEHQESQSEVGNDDPLANDGEGRSCEKIAKPAKTNAKATKESIRTGNPKQKQNRTSAAARNQPARSKKRKVVQVSPEPAFQTHVSRSGRRVRMCRTY